MVLVLGLCAHDVEKKIHGGALIIENLLHKKTMSEQQ